MLSVGAAPLKSPYDYHYRPGESVDCRAKSDEQTARFLGGRRGQTWGTSFAAPNVTGLVALFLERHPGSSLHAVRALLARHALGRSRR